MMFRLFREGNPPKHSSHAFVLAMSNVVNDYNEMLDSLNMSGSIRPGRPNKDVSSSMCFIFHRER